MLTFTEPAATVLRTFASHPMLDEASGVRIAARPATERLQVRAVKGPQPEDVVVERDGARLYLGPHAAEQLRDKVLDVREDEAGRVEFLMRAS